MFIFLSSLILINQSKTFIKLIDRQQFFKNLQPQNRPSIAILMDSIIKFMEHRDFGSISNNSQHRNKNLQTTIFLIVILIQFLKNLDSNHYLSPFSYQQYIFCQAGFLILFTLLIQGIQKNIGLIVLSVVILSQQSYYKHQRTPNCGLVFTLCILTYLILILRFMPSRKQLNQLNVNLLEPEYHKYAKNPEQLIIQQMKGIQFYDRISPQHLRNFFQDLNGQYKPIPYHNLTHGFDVASSMKIFFRDFQLKNKLCKDQIDYICCLIAGYAHDAGHMGYTNGFYISTNHNLACVFAYQSPLQRMHCSILMNLLRKYDGIVPTKNKQWMVRMIIATDNMVNNTHRAILNQKKETMKRNFVSQEDAIFMKQVLIHAADLTSQTRQFQIASRWSTQLFFQFDAQHKQLVRHGLADNKVQRYLAKVKGQIGFFGVIVLPLFKELTQICPQFFKMFESAERNHSKWIQKLEEIQ